MRVNTIQISNFRCFSSFDLKVSGASLLVVGENAAGKSSLLAAVAKALGKDQSATRADFADPTKPFEAIVTLSGFTPADQKYFPKEFSLAGNVPTLKIGVRGTWDASEEEVELRVGFPDLAWNRATREQRDALHAIWFPAYRDPARLLQMVGARSILGRLLGSMNLSTSIETASDDIADALVDLSKDPVIGQLLLDARDKLASFIPGVDANAFTMGFQSISSRDLLKEFELLLKHSSPPLVVSRQSNGLGQLAVFAFALRLMISDPASLLLVDEPEVSLHPQAQRALVAAIRQLPNQSLISTHSSNVLDRGDPRSIVRLQRSATNVDAYRAASLSDADAQWLMKFVNPQTTEACFARKVVLVEGPSDRVALLHLARRLNRNFDAEGVTILNLQGGGGFAAHYELFGPPGLKMDVLGLCDEDKEQTWIDALQNAGVPVADRASLNAKGFYVCMKDLEDELISSLGIPAVQAIISAQGAGPAFAAFAQQPKKKTLSATDQLRGFIHGDNIRWVIHLIDALDLAKLPGALNALMSKV